ncbi:hypothetical protein HY990_02295 [Candidatus Micrarchaeota archaeon]|nr:hypothetical protein [Candidatus Micrarchaeota archaeon]
MVEAFRTPEIHSERPPIRGVLASRPQIESDVSVCFTTLSTTHSNYMNSVADYARTPAVASSVLDVRRNMDELGISPTTPALANRFERMLERV